MANGTINKNTKIVYDFYVDLLANPKSLKNKSICLLALGNCKYIDECRKHAKFVFVLEDFSFNPFSGFYFKDINSLKEMIENWLKTHNMKKFDLIVMNPPYDGNLHLKILETAIPYAKKTINISPIYWLSYTNRNKKEFCIIKKHIKSIDVVKAGEIEKMFNADFPSDLGIYVLDENGGWKPDYALVDKIMSKTKKATIDENMKDGWRVRISKVGGKMNNHRKHNMPANLGKLLYFYDGMKDNRPWYDFYQKNKWSKTTREITNSIKFNSENECKNFIASLTTSFGRYIENILCDVTYINENNILWMTDYTRPWTDKRFCEYFNITGYISDTEAEPGSEWEMILSAMKQYSSQSIL